MAAAAAQTQLMAGKRPQHKTSTRKSGGLVKKLKAEIDTIKKRHNAKVRGLNSAGTGVQSLIVDGVKIVVGAIGERLLHKAMPTSIPKLAKVGIKLGASYVVGVTLKQPSIGKGMLAATVLDTISDSNIPFLSSGSPSMFPIGENANYTEPNLLNDNSGWEHMYNIRMKDGRVLPYYYNHKTGQQAIDDGK